MGNLMGNENGNNGYRPNPLNYPLFLGMVLFCISFTPNKLNLSACGMPSSNFVCNSDEGYRTLEMNKITPNQQPNPNHKNFKRKDRRIAS